MTQLPVISGRQCVAVLERDGFTVRRQVGSHIVMRRDDPFSQTIGRWIAARSEPSSGRQASPSMNSFASSMHRTDYMPHRLADE